MNFLLAVLGHLRASLLSFPFPAFPARFLFISLSPAPELPAYGQSSTKKASAEEWELTSSVHPHNLRNSNTTFSFLDRTLKQAKDDSNIAVLFSRTDYLCCLFPRRLSPCESGRRAREKGKEKGCETSGRFVFKMAECSMADDYAIFKKERRPVRFTNFEGKVVFPHSVCQEEAVFLQLNGIQHHSRICHLGALIASDLLERRKAVRQWCSQCICYTLVACCNTAETTNQS